ncbi:MAG: DUF429 domain-containing protein [Conexivisphaerales archaeon]
MLCVGVDLAGSENRNTGFCSMTGKMYVKTRLIKSNNDLLENIRLSKPDLVSIDAPLSLPRGRISLEKKGPPHLRECDRELIRLGIRFLPLTLGPMRMLTARGMRLKDVLVNEHVKVIECYPGAAQDILGIPRKTQSIPMLQDKLLGLGIKGDIQARNLTHDELDAITAALVGIMYLKGECIAIGNADEGQIIIPDPKKISKFRNVD